MRGLAAGPAVLRRGWGRGVWGRAGPAFPCVASIQAPGVDWLDGAARASDGSGANVCMRACVSSPVLSCPVMSLACPFSCHQLSCTATSSTGLTRPITTDGIFSIFYPSFRAGRMPGWQKLGSSRAARPLYRLQKCEANAGLAGSWPPTPMRVGTDWRRWARGGLQSPRRSSRTATSERQG